MAKYYYIKSNGLYFNGAEDLFYGKMHLGTYNNNYKKVKEVQEYYTNKHQTILDDLKEHLSSIKTNTKEDKQNRLELKKNIELAEKKLELYINSTIEEVSEEKIIQMQQNLQLNAVFMGEVYSYFLKDLKGSLINLTKLSKNQLANIESNIKALSGNGIDFEKLCATNEDMTYDYLEEFQKMIINVSNIGFHEPQFLNEWFEMMQDKQGLATMKRALTNFKKKKNV